MTTVESVVTEIGLTHPIVYDIYDLCEEQGEELIQPAFCMYLYIQCNKRGTPENRFTYKTLCRCRMTKKVQENCK